MMAGNTYFPDRPDGTTAFCQTCPKDNSECIFLWANYDRELNGLDHHRVKEFWAVQREIRAGTYCSFPKPRVNK